MSERLSRKSRRNASVLVAVGTAAAILTGCSGGSEKPQAPTEVAVDMDKANAARDAIAGLYTACKMVKAERDPNAKTGIYNKNNGYDTAMKITADVEVSQDAQDYRKEYWTDDTVTWGDQAVRLDFYRATKDGFEQTGPRSYRPSELATDSGRTTFNVYPSANMRDGAVIVPYLGNSAETTEGAVTAGTPCGAIEKIDGAWKMLDKIPEVHAFGPEPIGSQYANAHSWE